MNICNANKAVSLKVKNFILNVSGIKEESITDYLVWKWRELDARFKYIDISTFTRQDESTMSGADFELELWLVGRKHHFPLVFQAKKFIADYGSYVSKLNYPASTQGQLTTLLAYAKSKKKLPFYAFYSIPDSKTRTMCGRGEVSDTSIFMADAFTVKSFADGNYGKKVSKNQLLNKTNPFHCLFCCPLSQSGAYFTHYFPTLAESVVARNNETLPNYVNMLLTGRMLELGKEEMLEAINRNELHVFRAVGVYDMRNLNDEFNGGPK